MNLAWASPFNHKLGTLASGAIGFTQLRVLPIHFGRETLRSIVVIMANTESLLWTSKSKETRGKAYL